MNREGIYEKLAEIFQDVFDEEGIRISDGTTAADIDGWDSLTHITLLSSVEEEFGIKFDMKAVLEMKNVGDMVDMIGELLRK